MSVAVRIADRLTRVWEPEFTGHIWEWADGLNLPQSTRAATFRPEESPWLLPIFEAWENPLVREIVVLAPAGSAKSLLAEILIAWIVKNAPGLTYYVCQSDGDAQDAMEDRILRMLAANHVTAELMPLDRSKKRVTKVQFPGMPLYALGPGLNNAQSKRVKYLLCDETHAWEEGALEAFRARTNAVSGAKILIVSTGPTTGDQTDKAYLAGDCQEFHVRCPRCQHLQEMRNVNMIYDTNADTMDADGNYRMDRLRASVYYRCANPECLARWKNDQVTRRQILDGARYVVKNPNAAADKKSFHFPAHVVPWLSWEDLAEKWVSANAAAKHGVLEMRKEYIQKQLGEAWDAAPREEDHANVGHRVGGYLKREPWPEELTRFGTADQQMAEFYCVAGAYSASGESRIVDAKVVSTFEEVEQFREENNIQPVRFGIDIAFNTKVTQERCAQYGWQGLWGKDQQDWPHDRSSPFHPICLAQFARRSIAGISEKPVKLPFSPRQRGHVGLGEKGRVSYCSYYYWSNPQGKDLWHHLHNGLGVGMTHARDIGRQFIEQTQVEVKVLEYNKTTGRKEWKWRVPGKRPDHYNDAWQMNLMMALMDDRISLSQMVLGASLPAEG